MTDFIDNPQDSTLQISGGAPELPEMIPWPPDPPPIAAIPDDKVIPWNPQRGEPIQRIDASAVTGTFDSWVAVVDKVHATTRAIEVTRSDVVWGSNETPSGKSIASAFSQPQTAIATAYPFPPRHDQAGYLISVGDIVTCVTGRDGRIWYFNDELPFVGQVVKADGDDATEDNTGGAGLTTLTVRRQSLSGDPDNVLFAGAALAGLLGPLGAEIRYSNVLVIKSPTSHHGYRVGDYVWVQRRGRYYFVVPARETFTAFVVDAGPGGEADFADNRYWVREYKNAVVYAGVNSYTLTPTTITQTDPTGSGGKSGRWVQATNMGEAVSKHGLYTETEASGPASAVRVVVSMFADIADGEPWYSFSHAIAVCEVTDGVTTVYPVDKIIITAGAGITAVVTDELNDDAEITITNTDPGSSANDVYIETVTGSPDTITNCDKITFVGATVDDQGGGDALVTIDNDQGLTGTGTDLFATEWVRVVATKTGIVTIDSGDWRGRVVKGHIAYFQGTTANANLAIEWSHAGTGPFDDISGDTTTGYDAGVGWANAQNYFEGDRRKDGVIDSWICLEDHVSIAAPATFADDRTANPTYWTTYGAVECGDSYENANVSRLYIDCGDGGKLKYGAFAAYADEYHARFWIQATEPESAPGETIS